MIKISQIRGLVFKGEADQKGACGHGQCEYVYEA